MSRGQWTDRRVDQVIGTLLRAGVILAATVVLAGGCAYLVEYGMDRPAFGVFHGEPPELRGIRAILRGALALRCRPFMQLGIVLLIATPVTRVAFSAFAFLARGDRVYVLITLLVLAILLYSLSAGH
jgi:uncharacterized membrane protein